MALTNITIDTQTNPLRGDAGRLSADATLISSGLTGTVTYQLRRRDRATHGTADGLGVLTFTSNSDLSTSTQVIAITAAQLQVILPLRTEWQVRCSDDSGATWTNWANFKTRDKRYQSPDAVTQLSDDSNLSAATATPAARTLNITNSAKATVVETSAGATVTNTDTVYVGTESSTDTDAGATIINTDPYQSPGGPVTIS